MARQWTTRVVVAFQSVCWCLAILLLLSRGLANVRAGYEAKARPEVEATGTGKRPLEDPEKRYAIGVGLILVAVLMVVASPVIVVARALDRHRYSSVEQLPDLGSPPRYEDIVSRAPSYSTLFHGGTAPQLPPQEVAACTTLELKRGDIV